MAGWICRVMGALILWQVLAPTRGNSRDLLDDMLQDGEIGNVGGMMDKVGEMLGELVDSLDAISSPCSFKCPNGAKPKERKNHIKSSNGCGTFGIDIDTSSVPGMTTCCDQHDFCYDTCTANKEVCDGEFKRCLLNMCQDIASTLQKDEYEGCQATAELMFTSTNLLGCTPFREAQAKACDCGQSDGQPEPDVTQANAGKSTLRHEKKSVNAEPIPGTESKRAESATRGEGVLETDTVLKATKLRAEKEHQHEDL